MQILQNKIQGPFMQIQNSCCCLTIIKEDYPQLIVAPHELIHQWQQTLDLLNFKYQVIINKNIQIAPIMLVTPKIVAHLPDMLFSRIIIDEAEYLQTQSITVNALRTILLSPSKLKNIDPSFCYNPDI